MTILCLRKSKGMVIIITNTLHEITSANAFPAEGFLPRPRMDKILKRVTRCKLVYIVAGVGCGKTQAVRHFIEQQQDAVVRWLHLTESDNIGSRYWENLTYTVSIDNPALAASLRKLGFPETLARFKQFTEIIRNEELRAPRTYIVLDDFHLIHSKQALKFTERCANLQIPGACVIIISRNEPEINAVALFAGGKADAVTEDDLRFTDEETEGFLKYCDISYNKKSIPQLVDATKGWAFAVKLLSMVLKRTPHDLEHALGTMKQNIYKLLETEAWSEFPDGIQKTMAGLSLLSELPLLPLDEMCDDKELMQNTPQLSSFIWYNSFIGDYIIHPLYSEFLDSKQYILSDEEKQDIYRRAVRWCSDKGFNLIALSYLAKLRQFDEMLEALLSYPFKMPPDTCEYLLGIFDSLNADGKDEKNKSLLLMESMFIPLLLVGTGRYAKAAAWSFESIKKWEHSDEPVANTLLHFAYGNLAYTDMYLCTSSHKFEFPEYVKKAIEYYKSSSTPPRAFSGAFYVADVRSFACVIGEHASLPEVDRYLEAVKLSGSYISQATYNRYYGYEDLVACEIAYFKNQIDKARTHAYEAILKAREKSQYSIAMAAVAYTLRIAVYEGDTTLAKEILKQLKGYLEIDEFWNRRLLYDVIVGHFYAHIRLPKLIPSWLVAEEKEMSSEVHIPVRELIVGVKSHIAAKKYNRALTVLISTYPRQPHERFLLGELILTLLLSIVRLGTGDTDGAIADFEKAYHMSFDGVLEMPFIELGKNLHPLIIEAMNQANCKIPQQWLKSIDRKASIYTKKASVIANAFKDRVNKKDPTLLSDREKDVLNDLYHGLSRDEIAQNRYLSINTVKKNLQSIYTKLDANNSVDAVRIALEHDLIT